MSHLDPDEAAPSSRASRLVEVNDRVVVSDADTAQAWRLGVPAQAPRGGQWIGVDGPIERPPAGDAQEIWVDGSARWGSYGRRLARREVVGRLGEIAVDRWFRDLEYETVQLFADPYQRAAADVLVAPALPLHRHPRYAPPWLTDAERSKAMAERGDPLSRLRSSLAANQAWFAQHRTTGPVVIEKAISHPGHRDGIEVWPSDSVEIIDADGTTRRVRYVTVSPPPEAQFSDLAVEVKTWSHTSWPTYGRHINADQLLRIVDKAEIVVWCRLIDDLPDPRPEIPPPEQATVELVGWNGVRDLVACGEPVWLTPVRAQLLVPAARVRPMDELTPDVQLTMPTWPRNAAPLLRGTGSCSHRTVATLCWTCAWADSFPDAPATNPDLGRVTVSAGNARFYHHMNRDEIVAVHGSWPFTAPIRVEQAADACLSLPACPGCFPQ